MHCLLASRRVWAGLLAVALGGAAGPAAAAAWRPVPGAADLEVDLSSARAHGPRVTAWVRHPGGAGPLGPWLRLAGAPATRAHRTAVEAEFDCGARTMRLLAMQAHDSAGRVVVVWGTAGPASTLADPRDAGVLPLYDALCELARARRRTD